MREYTLAKVGKMGDYDEKYGQKFWCETQEQLEPVSFNLMQGDPQAGDKITCEEVLLRETKKDKKPYHQLKKVKVISSDQTYAETDTQPVSRENAPKPSSIPESKIEQILELVRENNEMLKKLTYLPGEDKESMPDGFLEYEDG